jgi:hypothetical protein
MRGTKHDTGTEKLRYDLIPAAPLAQLAHVYTLGAAKYEDWNWQKGLAWSRVYAALMRHLQAWWMGAEIDPDDGQSHLSSVAWCAFTLMAFERERPEYDDRPRSRGYPGSPP